MFKGPCYLTVLASLAILVMARDPKRKRIVLSSDGKVIAQDIVDYEETNTLLITVGDVSKYKDYRSTVNLHDFNVGWLAMKDVSADICLLKPIPFDSKEHLPAFNDTINVDGTEIIFRQKTLDWTVNPTLMSYAEVENRTSHFLAEFCQAYKTYTLVPDAKHVHNDADTHQHNNRQRRCWFNCGICINAVSYYEKESIDLSASHFMEHMDGNDIMINSKREA